MIYTGPIGFGFLFVAADDDNASEAGKKDKWPDRATELIENRLSRDAEFEFRSPN